MEEGGRRRMRKRTQGPALGNAANSSIPRRRKMEEFALKIEGG